MKTLLAPLLLSALLLFGCSRGIDNKEAVRQGVVDYLSSRTNLNLSSMDVDVVSVSFRENEANAVVSFRPKGSGGSAQGMQIPYVLERKGNRWVVKGKAEGANPHGGAQMPGMGSGMGSQMPPGHPSPKEEPPAGAKK